MNYRILGRTGIEVSEIGMGCEGFAEDEGRMCKELVELAVKNGVNYIDVYSSNPLIRTKLGEAIQGRRDKFVLQAHLCTIWEDDQYKRTRNPKEIEASWNDLLERLQTDYIDVGMIHYCDDLNDWNNIVNGFAMQFAQKLKAEGKIKAIGMSSHNPIAALAAAENGLVDVILFSVNPCYDLMPADDDCYELFKPENYQKQFINMDPDRERFYETCQRLGIAITVMKAYGGGDLLSENSPAGKALTVNQCLHYALTRPAVATICTGAHSVKELQEALAYETATAEEKDYASALASFSNITWSGHCMYCGHCAPCPKNIDIAMVTKLLNLCKTQNTVPETVREHYAVLNHHASECIGCGACEKRCPFSVKVRENMAEAVKVFGK